MSTKRRNGARDTAKDIILGLAPSGAAPRQPKEGVSTPKPPEVVQRPTQPVQPTVVVDRRPDNSAFLGLQQQIAQLQKDNKDLLNAEKAARRRLEANQDTLQRQLYSTDNRSRSTDDIQRQLGALDGKMLHMSNDISGLRQILDRQVHDLMQINNEMKQRPAVDPNKIANSNQQLDGKLRDLHGTVMLLQQHIDREKKDREKEHRTLNDSINRLQDHIRKQDEAKTNILNNLSRKGDMDKEKLSEEARRLNEKIGLITGEVTKNMQDAQSKMRDEMNQRYAALEAALRLQAEKNAEREQNERQRLDTATRQQIDQLENIAKQIQQDRSKNKERFQKVNEALAALEHHLELENKKVDSLMNSEAQTRQLHEKGLLAKIQEVEDRLNGYVGGLTKSIDDVKSGKDGRIPNLDLDSLRREMEAIAADKNKLSMEGLLKLEEKMTRVQASLVQDKRELNQKLSTLEDSEAANKLRGQVSKLDGLHGDLENAQNRIRDKVEKQIPQDLNELSAKADNIKHQLNARLDQEEEERYLAIKELQEAFQKLQARNGGMADNGSAMLRREVEECKLAIKKLAESVTTVKNVLDKKITDESKQREKDIARLSK